MAQQIFSKKLPRASIQEIRGKWLDDRPVVGWWGDHEFLGDVRLVLLNVSAGQAMRQLEKWLLERGFTA